MNHINVNHDTSIIANLIIAVEDDVVDTFLRSLSYREDVTSSDYVYSYYLPQSTELKESL